MQNNYPRFLLRFRQTRCRRKLLLQRLLLPLTILFIISITTTFAQNEINDLYLSGQIINNESGAPIAGHKVYIQSNIPSGGGMSFYHIKYTDAEGFFYDTISTNAEKGSILIYTFDVNEEKYEIEEYFRFRWENIYHANVVLEVFDPGATSDFQANFFTLPDTITYNKLKYYFAD